MLLVAKRGREAEVEQIFEKWDLHAVRIGMVTADGMLRVKDRGTVVAEIPNRALTDEAPVYKRPFAEPAYLAEAQQLSLADLPRASDAAEVLLRLLASSTVASKRWVYRQYDHMVRTNTLVLPGMGAGVVRVKGTNRALALSTDCNGRFVYLDPYRGAQLAVAEAARNVACAGGEPIGATNCLNFGNPQKADIMWQFARAVAGMGDACRTLGVPITGGNVSLYNETDGRAVLPTPVIGVVGLIEDASRVVGRPFRADGDVVILLGESRGELGGSEYLKTVCGLVRGVPPALDLAREAALQRVLVAVAQSGLAVSAHDCAEGGLAVTLAECCFDSGLGVEASVPAVPDAAAHLADVQTLFSESATRAVVSTRPDQAQEVLARAAREGVPASVIGRVGGGRIRLSIDGRTVLDVALADAESAWATAIPRRFDRGGQA
jgi:phosphoribosylformylglycinamidine synthase II